MPGSILQSKENSLTAASTTIASGNLTTNPTNGNFLLVLAMSGSDTTMTVASTRGLTFTERANVIEAAILRRMRVFTAPVTGSGTEDVTVTFGASVADRQVLVLEIAGVSAYDVVGTATDTGSNPTTAASATNTAQPAIAIEVGVDLQGGTLTAGTGYTSFGSFWSASNRATVQYKAITTVAAQTGNFVNATSSRSISALVVFTDIATPAITLPPRDQMQPDGGAATFEVRATGVSALSYQWKRNGTTIAGATDRFYTRNWLTVADSGGFTCDVTDTNGTTTTVAASLTVYPTRNLNGSWPIMGARKAAPGNLRGAARTVLLSELFSTAYSNPGGGTVAPFPWLSTLLIAGGGTTYNETRAESVAVADSLTATVTWGAALSEGQPVTDAYVAVAILAVTRAEAQPVTDALTAGQLFASTLAEAQPVTDAMTALAILSSVINESVPVADALSGLGTFGVSLTESQPVLDSVSAGATAYSAAITEFIGGDGPAPFPWMNSILQAQGLLDSLAVGLVIPVTRAEAQPVAEALTGIITMGGVVTEAQPVTDAVASIMARSATLAETAGLTDFVSGGAATYAASYSETIALSEVISIALVAGLTLTEAVTLADSVAAPAGGVFSVTISETIPLLDAFAATITATIIWTDQTVITATWTPSVTGTAAWADAPGATSIWTQVSP